MPATHVLTVVFEKSGDKAWGLDRGVAGEAGTKAHSVASFGNFLGESRCLSAEKFPKFPTSVTLVNHPGTLLLQRTFFRVLCPVSCAVGVLKFPENVPLVISAQTGVAVPVVFHKA